MSIKNGGLRVNLTEVTYWPKTSDKMKCTLIWLGTAVVVIVMVVPGILGEEKSGVVELGFNLNEFSKALSQHDKKGTADTSTNKVSTVVSGDALQTIMSGLKALTGGNTAGGIKKIKSGLDAMGKELGKLIDLSGLENALKHPSQAIAKAIDAIVQVFHQIIDEGIKAVSSLFKGEDQISTAIRNIGTTSLIGLKRFTTEISTNMTSVLTKTMTPNIAIQNLAYSTGSALEDFTRNALSAVGDLLGDPELGKTLTSSLTEFEKLFNEMDMTKLKGKNFKEMVGEVVPVLQKINELFVDDAQAVIRSSLEKTQNPLVLVFDKFVIEEMDGVLDVMNMVLGEFGNMVRMGKMEEGFVNIIQYTGSSIEKMVDVAVRSFTQFLNTDVAISRNLKTGIDNIIKFTLGLFQQPINILVTTLDNVVTTEDPNIQKFKTIITRGLSNIENMAVNIAGNCTAFFNQDESLREKLTNLAVTVIDGMAKFVQLGVTIFDIDGNSTFAEAMRDILENVSTSTEAIRLSLDDFVGKYVSGEETQNRIVSIGQGFVKSSLSIFEKLAGKLLRNSEVNFVVTRTLQLAGVVTDQIFENIDDPLSLVSLSIETTNEFIQILVKAFQNLFPSASKAMTFPSQISQDLTNVLLKLVHGQLSVNNAIAEIVTLTIKSLKSIGEYTQLLVYNEVEKYKQIGDKISQGIKEAVQYALKNITGMVNGELDPQTGFKNIISGFVISVEEFLMDLMKEIGKMFKGTDPLSQVLKALNTGLQKEIGIVGNGLLEGMDIATDVMTRKLRLEKGFEKIFKLFLNILNQAYSTAAEFAVEIQNSFNLQ